MLQVVTIRVCLPIRVGAPLPPCPMNRGKCPTKNLPAQKAIAPTRIGTRQRLFNGLFVLLERLFFLLE